VFRAVMSRRRQWSLFRTKPSSEPAVQAAQAALGADPAVPDCRTPDDRVLDYRELEGLRLVSGEIYADY
jgi:hypothetical protein